jgi:Uma2 family endonuclease
MVVESKKYIFDDFLKFHEKLGERGGFEFSEGLIYDKYAGKPLEESLVEYVLSDVFNENELPLFEMPTQEHDRITSNLSYLLMRFLLEKGYFVYVQKTAIAKSSKGFREPDIVVVKSEEEKRNKFHQVENPILVVEVLSSSTQQIDLSEKLLEYQTIPSVETYIIVWQNKAQVVVYQRLEAKKWEEQIYDSLNEKVYIKNLNIEIPLQEIYKNLIVE